MRIEAQKKLKAIYEHDRYGWGVVLHGELIGGIWKDPSDVIWVKLPSGRNIKLKDIDESQISVYRHIENWQEVNLED